MSTKFHSLPQTQTFHPSGPFAVATWLAGGSERGPVFHVPGLAEARAAGGEWNTAAGVTGRVLVVAAGGLCVGVTGTSFF